jgi:hypothetical protein
MCGSVMGDNLGRGGSLAWLVGSDTLNSWKFDEITI